MRGMLWGGVLLLCGAALAQESMVLVDLQRADARAQLAGGEFERHNVGGRKLFAMPISEDPYTEPVWELALPALAQAAGQTVTLELHFYDHGAGVIDASLAWGATSLAPVRKCGYTRCNTGTDRFTALEFALPAETPTAEVKLLVKGLQYPLQIVQRAKQEGAYWVARAAALPKGVKPMVTLKRPMRLVTTAGIDVVGGMDTLQASLEQIDELAPLCRALGMTSIEGYVTWKRLEPTQEGVFDFSFYDAIVERLAQNDLKFFPLLIVGSGYALPDWFMASEDNIGFVCLEHGQENAVQSIWSPRHRRHVERVLQAFGEHYGPTGRLEAVRLGPSGNYGESQYPAGGNWGPKGAAMHIHLGWWAGDRYGREDFRRFLREKYGDVARLNAAWEISLSSFDAADCVLPETMVSRRQRADFTQWYTDSMSDWCAWWGEVTRRALPDTPIYQSAGGWGFREAGTEYSVQAEGMVPIGGGIRLTNETDSFEQNFYATRLAATAARLYNIPLGYEPASGHTARGVVGRIFNTLTTNGDHLFTYHSNLLYSQMAIDKWLRYLPMFDARQAPKIEVAVYYPETDNQLGDAAFRYLYAWGFNPRAAAVRRVVDVDYLDDHLLRGGFLDRYKVLVWVWGEVIEADVQARIDAWMQAGGTLLYPSFPRGPLRTVEGETEIYNRWAAGKTGKGRFVRFKGDMEPPSLYGDFVREELLKTNSLSRMIRQVVDLDLPEHVFVSVCEDGHALVLNYSEEEVRMNRVGRASKFSVAPYGIQRVEWSE